MVGITTLTVTPHIVRFAHPTFKLNVVVFLTIYKKSDRLTTLLTAKPDVFSGNSRLRYGL